MEKTEIAKLIDHTQLNACATEKEITKLCEEAKKYNFASCCVNPFYVPLVKTLLENSSVKVCTVISFPLGATSIDDKASAAFISVSEGADEIDMVLNLGKVKEGDFDYIFEEIYAVRCACNDARSDSKNIILKVILETCCLTDEEIIKCCLEAKKAGADFVKTSTGFAASGATVHHVELMRKTVGNEMGVKASGGIHSYEEACALINAGATRLGCSASLKIIS